MASVPYLLYLNNHIYTDFNFMDICMVYRLVILQNKNNFIKGLKTLVNSFGNFTSNICTDFNQCTIFFCAGYTSDLEQATRTRIAKTSLRF